MATFWKEYLTEGYIHKPSFQNIQYFVGSLNQVSFTNTLLLFFPCSFLIRFFVLEKGEYNGQSSKPNKHFNHIILSLGSSHQCLEAKAFMQSFIFFFFENVD